MAVPTLRLSAAYFPKSRLSQASRGVCAVVALGAAALEAPSGVIGCGEGASDGNEKIFSPGSPMPYARA